MTIILYDLKNWLRIHWGIQWQNDKTVHWQWCTVEPTVDNALFLSVNYKKERSVFNFSFLNFHQYWKFILSIPLLTTILQKLYLPSYQNEIVISYPCCWDSSNLIEPPEIRGNVYIVIVIMWEMNFILSCYVLCVIFLKKNIKPYFEKARLSIFEFVQHSSLIKRKRHEQSWKVYMKTCKSLKLRNDLLSELKYFVCYPVYLYIYEICII